MQQSDYEDFVSIIQVVAEQYGKKLSGSVLALYWQGLKDLDFAAVKEALGRHLRNTDTGQFMPKIADIRKMLEGSAQDSALQAWAKVDRAVRHVGTHVDVVFDDPLIHRVVYDMGGWIALGTKTEDEWPFVAREFENRYRGLKARNERPEYPPVLTGIASAHNSKEGFRLAPPTMIGNAEQAMLTMQHGSNAQMIGFKKMDDVPVQVRLEGRAA